MAKKKPTKKPVRRPIKVKTPPASPKPKGRSKKPPRVVATPPVPPPTILESNKSLQEQLRDLLSQHTVSINDRLTLLCPPEQLPDPPDHSDLLFRLIAEKSDLYGKMLTMIILGGSVPICCAIAGITRHRLVRWRELGLRDLEQGIDSYYSRFLEDINFAALVPYIEAETQIHRKDPLEWLRTGPGKWVGREGTWQISPTKNPEIAEPPATVGIAEDAATGNDTGDDDLMADVPTVRDLPDVLQVWRDSGLGYLIPEARKESTPNASNLTKTPGTNHTQDSGFPDSHHASNGKA